ncbi:hypothetical protein Goshw_028336 [Gossypium schwendimanii]|uniref:DUF7745 domain-containing protein n=3 Tax=Gossypium TaxID=3633 RepID=A0A7J9LJS6_GOSSC|nr:hypothetical protein [Gossypium schwendimanii]
MFFIFQPPQTAAPLPATGGRRDGLAPKLARLWKSLKEGGESSQIESLSWKKGFLGKVEDNTAVQTWSETTQWKKGDSLAEGYWNDEVKQLFYSGYGDLSYLLDIKVDKHLLHALAQFWNPACSCFTFGGVDLVPSVEEYMALLCWSKIQVYKAYSRVVNVPTFLKKLMNITRMSEQWVAARIKQKGDTKYLKELEGSNSSTPEYEEESYSSPGNFSRNFLIAERMPESREVAIPGQDDITEEKWMAMFQNLQEEDIKWRAPWMLLDEILYRCGTIRQDFERRNSELEKKIEQMEEEKMNLRLDMDVQNLETEKLRKGKNKAEGDLDSLKTDYKKLRFSMKTVELEKTSEKRCQEIQEEKIKADRWERKLQ